MRHSSYAESQRYDQIYDDNRKYQSRDFFFNYSNYSNDADKINFNSNSFYSKFFSSQNDVNRTQKSSFNINQISNDSEYQSRFDSLRNTSSKNNLSAAFDQIRSNWTSRSIQFSSRSNEFDRRNDEYKNKIYNMNMKNSKMKKEFFMKKNNDHEFLQNS